MQTFSLQHCYAPPLSIPANLAFMEGIAEDQETVRALVEWAMMPPSKLAKEAGLAATTITRAYKGTATTRMSLPTRQKLMARFPDFPGWGRNGQVRSEVSGFGDRPFEEKYGSADLPMIPVIGSALGMTSFDPERDIELTEIDTAEVQGRVRRPVSVADDEQAYALTVIGDSMSPKYDPGARIIVSPKATVSINDYVVVQLRSDEDVQMAPTMPDPVALVLIKRLVRRSASYIELRQFNPDVTFRVEAARVAKIHKVLGEVF